MTREQNIAILSPGDMGNAVGKVLRHNGYGIRTSLEGRSQRTATLAAAAGFDIDTSDRELVTNSGIIVSILVPSEAIRTAERIAAVVKQLGPDDPKPIYVDLNAISMKSAQRVQEIVEDAGMRMVDGGIMGGPPQIGGYQPRIYLSGELAPQIQDMLVRGGLDVRILGPDIGKASAFKMMYASLHKGLTALCIQASVSAKALDLLPQLQQELADSSPTMLTNMEKGVPGMAPKAYRWVGEMDEIADTYEAVGMTPTIFRGAADLYRFVTSTELAKEVPEDPRKSLDETVTILANAL
ncbi:hypothetical protein BZG36_00184 [Bifiguratus adelaidae]|uniref:Phosphogluconate dehydrogenase NAD-binding putative C-terminal domain-containing protein n=1 Tax=Bifiguratus adelaidae TaxID=1938954 RepID=A0A261Y879_9FUNG|nr:hypothetical protein BZG36_00184 [Bifiguratus adelaidae]